MSKLSKKDQATIEEQVSRLYQAFPLLFADVVNKNLKDEIVQLKKQNEELMKQAKETLEFTLGNLVILEAFMGFNSGITGMICNCPHCCHHFSIPLKPENAADECKIWKHILTCMYLDDIKHTSLITRNGTVVRHSPRPDDFPPPTILFANERVSHLAYHLVFDQRGNPYNFSYGTRLTYCTSPADKEIKNFNEFLQTLREDSLTAIHLPA